MFITLSYSMFRAAHVFLYLDKNQAVFNDKIMIIKNPNDHNSSRSVGRSYEAAIKELTATS